jgi:hypothetical protein
MGIRWARLCIGCAMALSGCSDTARVFPMDQASAQAGVPKFEFVRQGLGRGPVTITMPDGEILKGEYQVTENASVGMAVSGSHIATGVGYGSGRHTVVSATGDHGTIMNCDLMLDIGGHGSGVCQTSPQNAQYRVMV